MEVENIRLEWFLCERKKKLLQVDLTKNFEGIYIKCPKCARIIEITNKKRTQSPLKWNL